jgi:hypothetical protein
MSLVVLVSMLAVLVVQAPAWAAPGDPDTGFAGDGFQTLDFPGGSDDTASAVLVQADGRIVVVGYAVPGGGKANFALARLKANGTIDTSFSVDGFRVLDFRG